jgi:hypothetical protein
MDPVRQQVFDFFGQKFDPRNYMPSKDVKLFLGTDAAEWVEHWETVADNFDVFKWWESVGREECPLIYPVACRILSLPDSNGGQERTFSAATWMDEKLGTRQTDLTFQMKVLLYKNQTFLEEHRDHVHLDKKREAEQRTKELLAKSLSMRDEDGSDDEELQAMIAEHENNTPDNDD